MIERSGNMQYSIVAALLVACLSGVTQSSDTPPEDFQVHGKTRENKSNFFEAYILWWKIVD